MSKPNKNTASSEYRKYIGERGRYLKEWYWYLSGSFKIFISVVNLVALFFILKFLKELSSDAVASDGISGLIVPIIIFAILLAVGYQHSKSAWYLPDKMMLCSAYRVFDSSDAPLVKRTLATLIAIPTAVYMVGIFIVLAYVPGMFIAVLLGRPEALFIGCCGWYWALYMLYRFNNNSFDRIFKTATGIEYSDPLQENNDDDIVLANLKYDFRQQREKTWLLLLLFMTLGVNATLCYIIEKNDYFLVF